MHLWCKWGEEEEAAETSLEEEVETMKWESEVLGVAVQNIFLVPGY